MEAAIKNQKGFVRHFFYSMVLVLITLTSAGYGKVAMSNRIVAMSQKLHETYEIVNYTRTLSSSLTGVRLCERGYLLTAEERYYNALQNNARAFRNQNLVLLSRFEDSSVEWAMLTTIQEDFERFIADAVTPLLALRPPDRAGISAEEQRRYSALMDVSRTTSDELSSIIADFEERQHNELLARRLEVERLAAIDRRTTIIAPIVIILVTFLSGLYTTLRLERYKQQQKNDREQLRITGDRLAMVIEGTNLGTYEWDIPTGTLVINDQLAANIGYSRQECEPCTTETVKRLVHHDDLPLIMQRTEKLLHKEIEFYRADIRLKHKDGHWVWVLDQGKIISWDEEGNPLLMIGTHTDISERVKGAEELKQQEEESRKLLDTMNQGFAYCKIIVDGEGVPVDYQMLRFNNNFHAQTGLPEERLAGRLLSEFDVGDVAAPLIEKNGQVALTGESLNFEIYSSLSNRFFRISSYCPQIGYFAMILDDITQERALETQLGEERRLIKTTLFNIADGVITTDGSGIVQFMNPTAESLTGWSDGEARGQELDMVLRIFSSRDGRRLTSPFEQVMTERASTTSNEWTTLVSRDGVQVYAAGKATPIIGDNGEITGVVIIMRDVTEERKRQQEILNLSYVDPLTGLHNRRFYDQSKRELDSAAHYPLSLIIADVNGLKLTNDAFGHDAGDTLLQTAVKALTDASPAKAVISRIGGDEFVILLPNSSEEEAVAVINRCITLLAPIHVHDVPVSMSFGHATKEDGEAPYEAIFKQAEDVMYQNKLGINLSFKKALITAVLDRLFEEHPEFSDHCQQVGFYCREFARTLGYPHDTVDQMHLAGLYHDIGRIAIDPTLLEKPPDELTGSELIELQRHAEIGYNILSSVPDYSFIARAVLHHHERWDGRGYPQGLKGSLIPRSAQVLAIANSFVDALEALGGDEESACRTLIDNGRRYFDPTLVQRFIDEVVLPNSQPPLSEPGSPGLHA